MSVHDVIFFLVCDPVLGDEGKLYVPPELVEVYREKVSSSSVTPVGMHVFYSILESWAKFEILEAICKTVPSIELGGSF